MPGVPVVWYIPNLLGYARVVLAFWGLHFSETAPVTAVCLWMISASLDLIDGPLARALNQTSSFGVLVDIAADNILRTTIWVATATVGKDYKCIAVFLISLEWTTMLCTQLHASQFGGHWKLLRDNDPWWVKKIFANNFKNPIGTLCIFGLFCAGPFAYGSQHDVIFVMIPYYNYWMYAAFIGRAVSGLAELWLTMGYIQQVIDHDTEVVQTKRPK